MSESYPYNYPGYPRGLDYPWDYPRPSEKERDRRWSALRAAMQQHQIDCLILGNVSGYVFFPNSFLNWISNYVPVFNPGTYVVFPMDGQPQLVVNNSIGPQFQHFAGAVSWVRDIRGSSSPAVDIVNRIKALKSEKHHIGIVGYNNGTFPAVVYDVLRQGLPLAKFEDATPVLVEVMNELSRTSTEELAFLKKACEIHDLSFQAVAAALRPGVTEKELWAVCEKVILENGGWFPHFMLVTSGPRPTFVRAPASHHKLDTGDIVMFETNIVYGGVLAQTAFTLSLGRPEEPILAMFDLCSELYRFALAQLEKHRKFGDIEKDIVDRIHAVGYEPMTPQMHIYNASGSMPAGSPAQPGDYFTVHPNFSNRDFTVGAKFGDCVRMNPEGKIEKLLKTPPGLNIIPL